jgi:hypothetical protein
MTYRRLKPELIVETTRKLLARVGERFPGSGLSSVCQDLLSVAEKAAKTSAWIDKPNLWLRAGVVFCILVIMGVGIAGLISLKNFSGQASVYEVLQGIDAGINDLVFIAIAILFLVTWENRIKRNRAMKALHELRSMAHIIDMHQLTKDPERLLNQGESTPSSPQRRMTPFQLGRYLDYCSEMLAIISKIAALYVQEYDDDATLAAVNEIETLTSGLSRKIWQKIMAVEHHDTRTPG